MATEDDDPETAAWLAHDYVDLCAQRNHAWIDGADAWPPGLIDECGLKGTRIGGAMVTPRHANIFINAGGATASDVRALIAHVQEVVRERTGYSLEPEISFVGEF